jgi:recombination protein RecA
MDKNAALNDALAIIEKQFGKGSIMRLWDKDWGLKIETFSSGSLSLDMALGGWYAKWRIVEIYWPESSGKTTLTLHAIAEMQKTGWVAAFIDAEHALDPTYAAKIGVDTDNLLISQPDYWEQALEIVDSLVRSWAVDLIVVDSVAALTPKAEIEWDMGDSHMWLQARLMSQALRKLTWAISRSGTTVIFINQIRMKIWVMFGSPETTTWGNALKFYASQRVDIRRKAKIESWAWMEKEVNWNLTKVKVIKNKVAPPFREADFDIMYNEGISKVWEILDIWANTWVIKKSWAFYSYWETKLGQWREKSKIFLKENPEIADEIEEVIKNSLES